MSHIEQQDSSSDQHQEDDFQLGELTTAGSQHQLALAAPRLLFRKTRRGALRYIAKKQFFLVALNALLAFELVFCLVGFIVLIAALSGSIGQKPVVVSVPSCAEYKTLAETLRELLQERKLEFARSIKGQVEQASLLCKQAKRVSTQVFSTKRLSRAKPGGAVPSKPIPSMHNLICSSVQKKNLSSSDSSQPLKRSSLTTGIHFVYLLLPITAKLENDRLVSRNSHCAVLKANVLNDIDLNQLRCSKFKFDTNYSDSAKQVQLLGIFSHSAAVLTQMHRVRIVLTDGCVFPSVGLSLRLVSLARIFGGKVS